MAKPTGPTNVYLQRLIENLRKRSFELDAPIWKTVAEKLGKSRRQKVEVNLTDIDRNTKKDDTVLVLGIVLASGELNKPVNVAAWRFSSKAIEKIKLAKGKIMSIEELIQENPKGSKVKILT